MYYLSHRLVFAKKVFGLVFTLLFVSAAIFLTISKGLPWVLFGLPAIATWRIASQYIITYDDRTIEIKGWTKTYKYLLANVKSLEDNSFFPLDYSFKLEIVDENGDCKSFRFNPTFFDSTIYIDPEEIKGQFQFFRMHVRHAKSAVNNDKL
jgi:hypothetical protein